MANLEQEEELRILAGHVRTALESIYGKRKAFFLCVGDFETDEGVADYIGNAQRETAVKWMKDTVERFESGNTIPASKGRMQ